MVERNYAEQLEPGFEVADGINRLNAEEGVRWLYSFLSADRRKTYACTSRPRRRPSDPPPRVPVCLPTSSSK